MKTHIHNKNVSSRFSSAAHTYEAISQLQDRVARRLMDMLPSGIKPMRILDAGCGTGRIIFTARKRWPDAHCTGVDIAPGMIGEASRHLSADPLVDLEVADISQYVTPIPFDLLLSSSSLHWLRPFDTGLAHTAGLCGPGGLAAISIMLDGTLGELHQSRRAAAPDKIPGGRLPTFDEFETAARNIPGTRIRRIEHVAAEFDQPTARDVLKTVHEMGVTGGDVSRSHAPLSRAELRRLVDYYEENFKSPEGVKVTFQVGYLLLERET